MNSGCTKIKSFTWTRYGSSSRHTQHTDSHSTHTHTHTHTHTQIPFPYVQANSALRSLNVKGTQCHIKSPYKGADKRLLTMQVCYILFAFFATLIDTFFRSPYALGMRNVHFQLLFSGGKVWGWNWKKSSLGLLSEGTLISFIKKTHGPTKISVCFGLRHSRLMHAMSLLVTDL